MEFTYILTSVIASDILLPLLLYLNNVAFIVVKISNTVNIMVHDNFATGEY